MTAREVTVGEYLEAGADGRALLELVAHTGKKIMTLTRKMKSFSPGDPFDVSSVWFDSPYDVSRITTFNGITQRETGTQAQSRDGVGGALKAFFNALAGENTLLEIESDQKNGKKMYFKYEKPSFDSEGGFKVESSCTDNSDNVKASTVAPVTSLRHSWRKFFRSVTPSSSGNYYSRSGTPPDP